jgi:aspartate-semialdehyde dehydrogenase
MVPLTAENIETSRAVFLAGSPASSRRAAKTAPNTSGRPGPALIDLTFALEEQPNARLRAPLAERAPVEATSQIQIIAHPASIAIAGLLTRVADSSPIRRTIVHVFAPASTLGQKGIDELQQQTVAVLSFQKLKQDVFDTQTAFSMLARYGEEAEEPLEGIEKTIERHLASLLASFEAVPMPSLRLIQAPVFHGLSFSVWIEFSSAPDLAELAKSLADRGIDVRPDEPPTNVGAAGQSGLSIGAIEEDANHPRACWIWMAADNLRLAAENAVAVAREYL